MKKTYVEILAEVPKRANNDKSWTLHFQKVIYHYGDGESEKGFRFIWRRPDGSLQAARGQARIRSKADLESLMQMAEENNFFA